MDGDGHDPAAHLPDWGDGDVGTTRLGEWMKMAYEKVKLVVAGVSGEIYMAAINNDGTMSMKRRKVTEHCKRATAEWFMTNRKKMVQYGSDEEGHKPTLFFTDDSEKAKRILAILEEE